MKCPNCGQLYVDTAKFCPSCGAPNEYYGQEVPPEQEQQTEYRQEESYEEPVRGSYTYQEDNYDYGAPRNPQTQPVSNGYGVASVVFGIIGILFGGLICGILSIVFSSISRREAGPNGMTTAGKVLGIITLIKLIIAVIVVIFLMVNYGTQIMEMYDITGATGLFMMM